MPERIQKYSHLPQLYICLSHVSDPSQTNSDGGSSDLDDGELDQPLNLQPSEPTPLDPTELKKAAATWILKVKEGHKLTMNSILNDLTEFNRFPLQDLHSVVIQKIGQLVWTQIQFLAYQKFLTQIAFMVNGFKDWRPSTYSRSTFERIPILILLERLLQNRTIWTEVH